MKARHPRLVATAALIALIGTITACGDSLTGPAEPITELPRALSASEVEIIAASNAFAQDLLGQVHAAVPDSTVFLSPLSASFALGMTMNGAEGDTRSQMQEMLGFGELGMPEVNASYRDLITLLGTLDPHVELGIANAMFHRTGFPIVPTFTQTLDDYFAAPVQELDFDDPSAAATINGWASERTNGRIPEVIEPPIDVSVVLYLLNAIYFNGTWTTQFEPADSYDGPFTTPTGTSTVRFMTKEDSLGYRSSAMWRAVEIPYGGGAWTMVVALPGAGRTLADVVDDMGDLLDPEAGWGGRNVTLHLPKVELEWERVLNDDLMALGMVDAFDAVGADFGGMSPDPLFISKVKQNTFLRVDEVGTEAAAVTVVEGSLVGGGGPPQFRADRPFFMAIRERLSGTVLFAGLIVEPPQS